jgi:hypothetical protein
MYSLNGLLELKFYNHEIISITKKKKSVYLRKFSVNKQYISISNILYTKIFVGIFSVNKFFYGWILFIDKSCKKKMFVGIPLVMKIKNLKSKKI